MVYTNRGNISRIIIGPTKANGLRWIGFHLTSHVDGVHVDGAHGALFGAGFTAGCIYIRERA